MKQHNEGSHPFMTFAQKLKQLRDRAGMSQEALARAAGMSVGNVHNYEQGIREPRWRAVVLLARALGVDSRAFEECVDAEEPAPAKKRKK
jgi:transcriptional regulator with XRE-family HTH domain